MAHEPCQMWMPSAMFATMYAIATGTRCEAVEQVVVGITADEVVVGRSPRLVQKVEDQEQGDDDARPPHRARREVGRDVVARRLVLHAGALRG